MESLLIILAFEVGMEKNIFKKRCFHSFYFYFVRNIDPEDVEDVSCELSPIFINLLPDNESSLAEQGQGRTV